MIGAYGRDEDGLMTFSTASLTTLTMLVGPASSYLPGCRKRCSLGMSGA
jgi:hypothetical protein